MWLSKTREQFLYTYYPRKDPTDKVAFHRKWFKPEPWATSKQLPTQTQTQPNDTAQPLQQQYGAPPVGALQVQTWVFPSISDVSYGLAIPLNVLKDNQLTREPHITIQQAMEDLVEYVESGRFRAAFLSETDVLDLELAIIRIAKEEGV